MWIYHRTMKSCSVLAVTTGAYAERFCAREEWRKAYVSTIWILPKINYIVHIEIKLKEIWQKVFIYYISIDGLIFNILDVKF